MRYTMIPSITGHLRSGFAKDVFAGTTTISIDCTVDEYNLIAYINSKTGSNFKDLGYLYQNQYYNDNRDTSYRNLYAFNLISDILKDSDYYNAQDSEKNYIQETKKLSENQKNIRTKLSEICKFNVESSDDSVAIETYLNFINSRLNEN